MGERRLYSEELEDTGDASTSLIVKGRVVEQGWIRYVTAAGFEDETTAPTTIGFGKYRKDRYISLEEVESASAGVRQRLRKTHHFLPGERPAIRVEVGGTTDTVSAYLEGYEQQI